MEGNDTPPIDFPLRMRETIQLTPEGQLEFWNQLHAPFVLTEAQKRLGAMMGGADGKPVEDSHGQP